MIKRKWKISVTFSFCVLIFGCQTAEISPQPTTISDLDHAVMLLKNKHYDKAIEAFQRAIELDPFSVEAHAGLAWSFYNLGEIDLAISAAERIAEIQPHHPDLPTLRAVIEQFKKQR